MGPNRPPRHLPSGRRRAACSPPNGAMSLSTGNPQLIGPPRPPFHSFDHLCLLEPLALTTTTTGSIRIRDGVSRRIHQPACSRNSLCPSTSVSSNSASGLLGVVSFSDPVPRTSATGNFVFPGHVGLIYQASNATYLGRATPRTLRLLPDGRVLSDRALQKLRAGERGWHYVANLLEQFGVPPLSEDRPRWLATWLPRITRSLRHPGNHKYAWILPPRHRRHLPPSRPYPKVQSGQLRLPFTRLPAPAGGPTGHGAAPSGPGHVPTTPRRL